VNPALPLVDLSRAWPGGRRWRPVSALAERLLALDRLNALYQRHREGDPAAPAFCRRILDGLGVATRIPAPDLDRLKAVQGPALVLANHPLGGREALFLHLILGAVRPDYRILANHLIGRVPEVREKLFLVDPFGGPAAAQDNRQALRDALRWLGQGGLLGVFPAGELSYWQPDERRVADPAWAPQVARLARRSGATVLPLHFSGQSSGWLRALARIHPALKTPWLVRELMQGPARMIEARLGLPLPAHALPGLDDRALAAWLRERCYALAA
jgi:putative hemolysin